MLLLLLSVRCLGLLQSLKDGLHFEEEKASRPCPACRVVIYRFAGCDDFLCSCGHKFNFVKAVWPTVPELEREIAAIEAAADPAGSGAEVDADGTGATQGAT